MITNTEVGQSIDENENILNPSTVISDAKGKIFVRAALEGASVGESIKTQVTYLLTGEVGLQKTFQITQVGSDYLLLTYSAPTAGWLPGNYEVELSPSSGQKKSVFLTVKAE